jgi:hypothetical protein
MRSTTRVVVVVVVVVIVFVVVLFLAGILDVRRVPFVPLAKIATVRIRGGGVDASSASRYAPAIPPPPRAPGAGSFGPSCEIALVARPSSSSSSSSEAFSIPEVDVGLPMLVPPGGGGLGALLWNRKSTKASKSSPHVFGRLDIIIYPPLRLESIRDVQV